MEGDLDLGDGDDDDDDGSGSLIVLKTYITDITLYRSMLVNPDPSKNGDVVVGRGCNKWVWPRQGYTCERALFASHSSM